MRIISMEPGSDMIAVFGRLVEGISMIGTALESEGYTYQYDDHYGYMSSEPSQLGTGKDLQYPICPHSWTLATAFSSSN